MNRLTVLLVVLTVHLTVAVAHGSTHALVPVALPPWQNALVLATVFLGPVVGVGLAVRGHPLGVPVFTVTMAGGLVLGVTLHFLVDNPDHVHAVPAGPWRWGFRTSALGVALTSAVGAAIGSWYVRQRAAESHRENGGSHPDAG